MNKYFFKINKSIYIYYYYYYYLKKKKKKKKKKKQYPIIDYYKECIFYLFKLLSLILHLFYKKTIITKYSTCND